MSRVVAVTGASAGVGRATGEAFGKLATGLPGAIAGHDLAGGVAMIAARLAAAALAASPMAGPSVVDAAGALSTGLPVLGPITAALSVAAASRVADAQRRLLFAPGGGDGHG